VEAFRTQRETMKAQYSAAKASTQVGEAVTGLSEHMADVNLMMERAQDKTQQMQARAAALDSLTDSGVLDTIGISSGDDIDRQLQGTLTDSQVDAQLAALKQEMLPAPVRRPPARDGRHPGASHRCHIDADLVRPVKDDGGAHPGRGPVPAQPHREAPA